MHNCAEPDTPLFAAACPCIINCHFFTNLLCFWSTRCLVLYSFLSLSNEQKLESAFRHSSHAMTQCAKEVTCTWIEFFQNNSGFGSTWHENIHVTSESSYLNWSARWQQTNSHIMVKSLCAFEVWKCQLVKTLEYNDQCDRKNSMG